MTLLLIKQETKKVNYSGFEEVPKIADLKVSELVVVIF